jgi:2-oxoglutarate dehydrogenase E1 component
MGAWSFIRDYLDESASKITKVGKVEYVGRSASASPATGFEYVHKKVQEEVISKAFGGKSNLGSQTLL